jgi:hypothetical protein
MITYFRRCDNECRYLGFTEITFAGPYADRLNPEAEITIGHVAGGLWNLYLWVVDSGCDTTSELALVDFTTGAVIAEILNFTADASSPDPGPPAPRCKSAQVRFNYNRLVSFRVKITMRACVNDALEAIFPGFNTAHVDLFAFNFDPIAFWDTCEPDKNTPAFPLEIISIGDECPGLG